MRGSLKTEQNENTETYIDERSSILHRKEVDPAAPDTATLLRLHPQSSVPP